MFFYHCDIVNTYIINHFDAKKMTWKISIAVPMRLGNVNWEHNSICSNANNILCWISLINTTKRNSLWRKKTVGTSLWANKLSLWNWVGPMGVTNFTLPAISVDSFVWSFFRFFFTHKDHIVRLCMTMSADLVGVWHF